MPRANPVYALTGTLSSLNSTTTALNNGSTYTGTWEDVSSFESLVVAVKTDQDGTFTVQFSPDGSNADSTLTRYYRTGNIEAPHRFTITRKYARVTFTNNSGSNQTYLRLQTSLGSKQQLNIPCDAVAAQDYDATIVRPTEYKNEVALGLRQNTATWNKFGFNSDVDTGTEVIASFGGTWSPSTSAETLDIVSDSAADDAGSTGATSLRLYGVDGNWALQTEDVTTDGVTPVTTSNPWLGLNRAVVLTVGSGGVNAGNISITGNSSSANYAHLPASGGTTQQCIFYVPASHTFLASYLYLNTLKISGGASPRVTIKGWAYASVTGAKYEVFRTDIDTSVENTVELHPAEPFVIDEKQVLWFEATTNTDNTACNVRFSGQLHRHVDA